MKIFPFMDVVREALELQLSDPQIETFQQFKCSHCGAKMTMAEPNKFYTWGTCELCDHSTNIQDNGCNYLLTKTKPGELRVSEMIKQLPPRIPN